MGSVCRNKGPDNEPGSENAKQNKTGENAFVAEPGLCLLWLFAAFPRLLGLRFPLMSSCWVARGQVISSPSFFPV